MTITTSDVDGVFTDDANNLPLNAVSFCYASAKNSPSYEVTILDVGGLVGYADSGKRLKFRTLNGDNGYWGAG